MKQKYMLALSGVIVIVAVLLLALTQVRSGRSSPQASTPTPTYGPNQNGTIVLPVIPTAIQPKITDLASDIPYEDKPAVVIRHSDGSLEEYLLAPGTVDAFLKNLPKGDKLELKMPPPSAMLTHEESIPLIMRSGVPVKVTDLSPDVADEDKGTLIIRHADGSEEAFFIAPDLVDQFISQLPKEDKLVQIISPSSIENAHP